MHAVRRLQGFLLSVVLLSGLIGCGGGAGNGGTDSTNSALASSSTTCADVAPRTIAGSVSGLTGTVQVQNNGGNVLSLTANSTFAFATPIPCGNTYNVTVSMQPVGQRCTVANGSGTAGTANVTNVAITCTNATGEGPISKVAVSAGFGYTLAVRADGSVLSIGNAMNGGSGVALPGAPATNVISRLNDIRVVHVGERTASVSSFAIATDGTVYGWGLSILGQLETGLFAADVNVDTPIVMTAAGKARALAYCGSGPQSLYVLHADGSVSFIPGMITYAPGGQSRTIASLKVPSLDSIVSLGQGCAPNSPGGSAVAVRADGTVWTMVPMADGTVWPMTPTFLADAGSGSTAIHNVVVAQVFGLPSISGISCTGTTLSGFCIALAKDGSVWAWGDNDVGQLGDGTRTPRTVPFQVAGLPLIRYVVTQGDASFALAADGRIFRWGGSPDTSATPELPVVVHFPVSASAVSLSVSASHVVALLADGTVWSWGSNGSGQFGDDTSGNSSVVPVKAIGINLN